MSYLLLIGIFVAVVAIIWIVIIRNRLKEKSQNFDNDIADAVSAVQPISSYEASRQVVSKAEEKHYDDIEEVIEVQFAERYMTGNDEKSIASQFIDIYREAYALAKKLEIFKIEPSYRLKKLLADYGNIHKLVKKHNEKYLENLLKRYSEFFDCCLAYPLDAQQRRS